LARLKQKATASSFKQSTKNKAKQAAEMLPIGDWPRESV
jgi:hypothetical protein